MKINTLTSTLLVGLIASIAFIILQPLFGMLSLTSRHASAYVELGNYQESTATILSWFVHVSVSICYAFVSNTIYRFNPSLLVSFAQIIFLGWFTTLIATPANEWVIKLISTGQFTAINSLAPLNIEIGPKFWLHILFFALVIAGLWIVRILGSSNNSKTEKQT